MQNQRLAEKIKIVFFDIDETLYVKNKAFVPQTVAPAIRALKAKGIIPAIATGRTRCAFPALINQLIEQEKIETFVTINGQYNSHQGKLVTQYPIPKADIEHFIQFFQANNIEYAFIANEAVAVSDITPRVKEALDPITTDYFIDKDYYQQHDIFQLLAFYDSRQDTFIQQSNILGEAYKVVRWHDFSVDLLAKSGSKARGIEDILQTLGLSVENAMAFGDGLNDIEMLSYVGFGVAMGNAHPTLKEIAKYVTTDIENAGIFTALTQLNIIE